MSKHRNIYVSLVFDRPEIDRLNANDPNACDSNDPLVHIVKAQSLSRPKDKTRDSPISKCQT